MEGIREKLRNHLKLAKTVEEWISKHESLEILAPVNFNTICFRYSQADLSVERLNVINEKWMNEVNASGKAFFSHTKDLGRGQKVYF